MKENPFKIGDIIRYNDNCNLKNRVGCVIGAGDVCLRIRWHDGTKGTAVGYVRYATLYNPVGKQLEFSFMEE